MPSEQRVRWARFRVTMMSIAALSILATLLSLLIGNTAFRPKAIVYVYLPDATGVARDSPVRVDGIEIGRVASIELSGLSDPNRVIRVTARVEAALLSTITEDSTAQTAADTLVGDKFVQITSGRSPNRVRSGAYIPFKGSPDLVKSIDLATFRKNLVEMDALLTEIEQGRSPLGQFVMGDQMYRDVTRRMQDLNRAIRTAASTTSSVGHELYTDALYRQVRKPFADLDQTLARIQSGQGPAGQLFRDNAQYEQLRAQAASLRDMIGYVRGLDLMQSSAMHDNLSRSIAAWIQTLDEFNATPAMETTAAYDNLTQMLKEIQRGSLEFRQDPRKFLRLGLF
jgi:ABC-type transporter Mla subunit MlaD